MLSQTYREKLNIQHKPPVIVQKNLIEPQAHGDIVANQCHRPQGLGEAMRLCSIKTG